MECREIQDLILTDYLDGQLGEKESNFIKEHLTSCSLCKEVFDNAQEFAKAPFKEAQQLEPPPELWHAIRSSIAEEKQKADQDKPGIIQWLIDCFTMPKPALAMASVLSVLLVTSVFFHNGGSPTQTAFNPEAQVDYIAYLLDEEITNTNGQSGDLGTPIEEYFL